MSYQVLELDNGKFTIIHPYETFEGFIYDTRHEAQEMIRLISREKSWARAENAAWDRYTRENCDE